MCYIIEANDENNKPSIITLKPGKITNNNKYLNL